MSPYIHNWFNQPHMRVKLDDDGRTLRLGYLSFPDFVESTENGRYKRRGLEE